MKIIQNDLLNSAFRVTIRVVQRYEKRSLSLCGAFRQQDCGVLLTTEHTTYHFILYGNNMNKERQKQNKIEQKTIKPWQKHSKKFSNLVLVPETMGSNSVTPTHRSILRGTPIFLLLLCEFSHVVAWKYIIFPQFDLLRSVPNQSAKKLMTQQVFQTCRNHQLNKQFRVTPRENLIPTGIIAQTSDPI